MTAPAFPQKSILVVDDEPLVCDAVKMMLNFDGHLVQTAASGQEALAILEKQGFDLVITDQTMPEKTGIELAREILAIRPDMPVILCTGYSHLVDAESAKAAGVKGFVMKPLRRKEIAKTVRKMLDE